MSLGFWENVARYFIGDYEDYGYGGISIDELPSGYD
jgi:hypothetical protein